MTDRVLTGADVLVREDFARIKGRKVGVVCNQTSVESRHLLHIIQLLRDAEGVSLSAVFAPEHGFRGEAQDMDPVNDLSEEGQGFSIFSLYGSSFESLSPRIEDLVDLDLLIVDMQDVGARYYTFAATMYLCMKVAAAAGVKVIVLDRPNPIGGEVVEGPLVNAGYESFVGLYPVPVRHGMTIAELAIWLNDSQNIQCELEVVPMEGWKRSMLYSDTGLTWVHPSPNMPTLKTALVYPGMCLIEGTRLSEGRGTSRPFEQCGDPFIDPDKLVARLNDIADRWQIGGVVFRPCYFRPVFQKHAGRVCGGAFIHIRDAHAMRPWAMGVAYIEAIIDLWPSELKWRTEPYEFVRDRLAIDLLLGSSAIREQWASGGSAWEIVNEARSDAERFEETRRPFLLYTD